MKDTTKEAFANNALVYFTSQRKLREIKDQIKALPSNDIKGKQALRYEKNRIIDIQRRAKEAIESYMKTKKSN